MTLQRLAHDQLLGTIERFVEAPHRHERAARTEQEASSGQASHPKQPDEDWHEQSRVQRNGSIELNRGATANGAVAQGHDSRTNHRLVHDRVRVHKDVQLTGRRARAGVSGRCNLAVDDADQKSAVLLCDEGGSIRRAIIGDHELVAFVKRPTCRVKRLECRAEQTFLVVGGDNERDHCRLSR